MGLMFKKSVFYFISLALFAQASALACTETDKDPCNDPNCPNRAAKFTKKRALPEGEDKDGKKSREEVPLQTVTYYKTDYLVPANLSREKAVQVLKALKEGDEKPFLPGGKFFGLPLDLFQQKDTEAGLLHMAIAESQEPVALALLNNPKISINRLAKGAHPALLAIRKPIIMLEFLKNLLQRPDLNLNYPREYRDASSGYVTKFPNILTEFFKRNKDRDDESEIRILLLQNPKISRDLKGEDCPLNQAAIHQPFSVPDLLKDPSISVNEVGENGQTALHTLVDRKDLALVQALLERKDLSATTIHLKGLLGTAFSSASRFTFRDPGSYSIAKRLARDSRFSFKNEHFQFFIPAMIKSNDYQFFLELLDQNPLFAISILSLSEERPSPEFKNAIHQARFVSLVSTHDVVGIREHLLEKRPVRLAPIFKILEEKNSPRALVFEFHKRLLALEKELSQEVIVKKPERQNLSDFLHQIGHLEEGKTLSGLTYLSGDYGPQRATLLAIARKLEPELYGKTLASLALATLKEALTRPGHSGPIPTCYRKSEKTFKTIQAAADTTQMLFGNSFRTTVRSSEEPLPNGLFPVERQMRPINPQAWENLDSSLRSNTSSSKEFIEKLAEVWLKQGE